MKSVEDLQEADKHFKVKEVCVTRALIRARMLVQGCARGSCDPVFYKFSSSEMGVTENSADTRCGLVAYASFEGMATEITALPGAVAIESGIFDGITDVAIENIEHAVLAAGQPIGAITDFKSEFLRRAELIGFFWCFEFVLIYFLIWVVWV